VGAPIGQPTDRSAVGAPIGQPTDRPAVGAPIGQPTDRSAVGALIGQPTGAAHSQPIMNCHCARDSRPSDYCGIAECTCNLSNIYSLSSDHSHSEHLHDEVLHVKSIIDALPVDLSDEQRCVAVDVICRNADVFSRHEFDLGRTDLIMHRIDTGDHRPISQPLRSHARAHLDLIDNTIDKLVQAGVVEEAASPWSANLVVVSKGPGSTPRITVDYRMLNNITYKDKFPLPKTADCIRAMSDSVFLSTADLSSSFFQVPLDPRDRDKTAFVTRKSQYRFTVMPQGAVNSPSVFCRLMSLVLKGLTWISCLVYVDDTIIVGRSFEEHVANLEVVLDRFRQAKLKLRPEKCQFFQFRVKFVGHIVSSSGIEVDADKVACILAWEFPRSMSELRGFIGMCSYYRAFCPSFSTVAEPLTECLRKGISLQWTERRQQSFDALKKFLTSAPLLAMPNDDPNCEFVLDCDASLVGAGAILHQWQDGQLKVIEYASRTFNGAERNYCVTRREMSAVIFGLRQFRQYLLGRHFTIRVDHMALTYYSKTPEPVGQQARFLDFISQFDFKLEYREGSRHSNCDSLSRLKPCERDLGEPCKQCNRRVVGRHRGDSREAMLSAVQTRAQKKQTTLVDVSTDPARDEPAVQTDFVNSKRFSMADQRNICRARKTGLLSRVAPNINTMDIIEWTPEFLAKQQELDPDIGPVIQWMAYGRRPDWAEMKPTSPALRALWRQYESLVSRDGAIYRIFHDLDGSVLHYQYVLPSCLKVTFLELVHADAAGHLKFAKCIGHVQCRAWWLTWRRDLKLFVACCAKCSGYHRGTVPRQGCLQPMVLGAPGERWVIDLTGPHPMSDHYKYLFTAVCPFSKYAIAVPIRNKEAATIARVMVHHIFLKWGWRSKSYPIWAPNLSQNLLANYSQYWVL
jgi:hypothetical protein